jgi:hypothetical protein
VRRALWKLHARFFGYFWLPCPICGYEFSGYEWGRHKYPERNSRAICHRCGEKQRSAA